MTVMLAGLHFETFSSQLGCLFLLSCLLFVPRFAMHVLKINFTNVICTQFKDEPFEAFGGLYALQ